MEELFETVTRVIFLRIVKVWYHPDWIYKYSTVYKKQKEAFDKIGEIGDKLLYRRKQMLLSGSNGQSDICKPFPDEMILKNPKFEMSDEQVLHEFRTFLLTGIDTNSTTISFVLTALGIYKDIQQKVYEEMIEVVGLHRKIQFEDLSKLQYLERVIKETLRLLPILPNVGRKTSGEIDIGDYILPEGLEVIVNIYSLHRNADYWPDPLKFDPDRFLPENSKDRHPYAWLPFSGGPRNCIGLKYGMMVVKIAVVMTVREYFINSDHKDINDIEWTVDIVTKSQKPLELSFAKRPLP